jgi:hypothetical protein
MNNQPSPALAALDWIADEIRKESFIPFHRDDLRISLSGKFKEYIGEPEATDQRLRSIINDVAQIAAERCPGLKVGLTESLYAAVLSVTGETEWADVLQLAHGTKDEDASKILSTPAAALLQRIESGELTEEFRTERSVRQRIHFFGYFASLKDLLQELRIKRGIEVQLIEKGEKHNQHKRYLKFAVVDRHNPLAPPAGLNPVLPSQDGRAPTRREFRRWFYQMLLMGYFSGKTNEFIWGFNSRREFRRCFPHMKAAETINTNFLVHVLRSVRGRLGLLVGWDFDYHSAVWSVEVVPETTWEDAYAKLRAFLSRPAHEEQFGLSSEAAELYAWVTELNPVALEHGLTPELEDAIKEQSLLLDCPWEQVNFRLYVDLLCEEITDKTSYHLRAVEWHDVRDTQTRIRVKQRHSQRGSS